MAKKKHPEDEPVITAETAVGDSENQPVEATGGLAEEVHVFLAKRNQLAQKLAQEIDATEKKLAELKRTAALLFPENGAMPPAEKEKQERKPKRPSSSKMPKSTVASANDDRPLLDQTADPISPESTTADTNGRSHTDNGSSNGEHS